MKLVDIDVLLHNIEELNIASFYEENEHSKEAYQEIKQMILNTPVVYTLLSAQLETCEGCKHLGKWENEVEYGYPSPCTRCKRRAGDYYEK